jgi:hypothetical protein
MFLQNKFIRQEGDAAFFCPREEGRLEKREVVTGRACGLLTQILGGLTEED